MTLIYRGQPYTTSKTAAVNSKEIPQTKSIQLIYRGQVFERRILQPSLPSQDSLQNTVQLIYRGQVYNCQPSDSRLNIKSCHVNWRFQYSNLVSPSHDNIESRMS